MEYYQKAVYKNPNWESIRNAVIMRDGGLCCFCGKIVTKRQTIHHKQEINEENYSNFDVAFNLDNLALCHTECHNRHHDRFGFKKSIVQDDLEIDYTKRLR